MRVLIYLNLHTETPRQLLIRACNCNLCTLHRQRKSNFRLIKIEPVNTGKHSKRRSHLTSAEVEVLLQDVDVSIIFHYGYFKAIEFSAYLFIHLHLQCSCTFTFTFSHLADACVQSDVQGREQSSYEQWRHSVTINTTLHKN